MTLRAFNSVGGYSVGDDPKIEVIFANGDITANNFTATGTSDLGAVANVKISGGTSGQTIVTDGAGNLTFADTNSNVAAPMPYYVPVGESYIVPTNFQGLFAQTIEIDGELVVDGELYDVSTWINSPNNQILFTSNNAPIGKEGFTFDPTTGNLDLPGLINITGNILPTTSNTFSLGSTTNRWKNLWLSGNTIYLGSSIITETNGNLSLINPQGGQFDVTGNSSYSDISVSGNVISSGLSITGNSTLNNLTITGTLNAGDITVSSIANGTSNVDIVGTSGNVTVSVGGVSNVAVFTSTGQNVAGSLTVSGNITTGNANLGNVVSANYLISNSGCVTISSGIIGVSGTAAGIFSSTITDINLGLAANITMGSTTGTITSRNNLNVNNTLTADTINGNSIIAGDFYSKRSSISVTNNTLIDSFGITEYRSAKYTIKVGDDTGYQALEVLLVHNDINSIITVYGSLSMTGIDLITLATTINGSNVELRATGLNANTSLNLMGTYVPD